MKVYIIIKDAKTGQKSKPVIIDEIIFSQDEVEFEFNDGTTIPYNDFLFFQEEYQVIIKVKEVNKSDK